MNITRNLVAAVLMTIVTTLLLGVDLSAGDHRRSRRSRFPTRPTGS